MKHLEVFELLNYHNFKLKKEKTEIKKVPGKLKFQTDGMHFKQAIVTKHCTVAISGDILYQL